MNTLFWITVVLIAIATAIAWIWAGSQGPLSTEELRQLAAKRRRRAERRLFSFASNELVADKTFKRTMPAGGAWREATIAHRVFPAWAAAHLKYKKHEWVVIGLSDGDSIRSIWMNKGLNAQSVALLVSLDNVLSVARRSNCRFILVLHNHPNSNPHRYNCTKPSQMDRVTAEAWWKRLKPEGFALAEFVCERGRHYMFFGQSPGNIVDEQKIWSILTKQNDGKFHRNAWLRLDLIFGI